MTTLLQLTKACRDVVSAAGGLRHYVGVSTTTTIVAGEAVTVKLDREQSVRAFQGKLRKMARVGRSAPGVAPSWHDLNAARLLFAASRRLARRANMADRRAALSTAATHLYQTIERCVYVRETIMGFDPREDGDRVRVHATCTSFVIECLCGRSELHDPDLSGPTWACECGMSLTVERGEA